MCDTVYGNGREIEYNASNKERSWVSISVVKYSSNQPVSGGEPSFKRQPPRPRLVLSGFMATNTGLETSRQQNRLCQIAKLNQRGRADQACRHVAGSAGGNAARHFVAKTVPALVRFESRYCPMKEGACH